MVIMLATPNEHYAMTFDTEKKEIYHDYFNRYVESKRNGILSSTVYVHTVKDFTIAKETVLDDGYTIVD